MTLSASLAAVLNAAYSQTLDVGAVQYPLAYGPNFVFTDGSGANQANKLFTDTRTLAASASESLDLNGVLTDAFGAVLNFTKIRALIIAASAANTNDVIVGNAASNGFVSWCGGATNTVTVKPGGLFMLVAPDVNGYAVTAATADLLKVLNGGAGTSIDYTITILGS